MPRNEKLPLRFQKAKSRDISRFPVANGKDRPVQTDLAGGLPLIGGDRVHYGK
jgi:hypothetical protein